MNQMPIDREVALVMGASRGIGAATARALAAEGFTVVLVARKVEACEKPLREIRTAHGDIAEAFSCDVTRYSEVKELIETILKRWGRLDCVINNAGSMHPIATVEKSDPNEWAASISLNLLGAFNGCRAVLPHFRSNNSGVIVNLSTGAAFHPLAGWSAYCAGKAGLAMFTRVLGVEVADTGILVFGFQPGMVNTATIRAGLKIKVNRISDMDPEKFSDPSLPGRAIAWLCRERPTRFSGGEVDINSPEFVDCAGLADQI